MPEYQSADGMTLHYLDEGEGLPVLCLAGLTRDARDFDYLSRHLDGVRLIRPDYRGRGKSGWSGADTYTVPVEAHDILALMDALSLDKAAVIGTSRGGLIAMMLGHLAKDRLMGVCLNDIGPAIEMAGLERIKDYVGRAPKAKTHTVLAEVLPKAYPEFSNMPEGRWLEEAQRHTVETEDGLGLTYDPALRDAFLAAFEGPAQTVWPLFDTLDGLPLALIRGAQSDLLSPETVAEMQRRRPDMIFAEVPGRGHIPFLDEPESLEAIHTWLEMMR